MSEKSFSLGQVVVTDRVRKALNQDQIWNLVMRHAELDQGELEESDYKLNLKAVEQGDQIFSCYEVDKGRYYVITEADRSCTTVLRSDEY